MLGVVQVLFEIVAEFVAVREVLTGLVLSDMVYAFSRLCTVGIAKRR